MRRSCSPVLMVIFMVAAMSNGGRAFAQTDDTVAVEAEVRTYEGAVERFEFAQANSMLAVGARWIRRFQAG